MKGHGDTMLRQSLDENGKEEVGTVLETGTGGADSASTSPRKWEPKEDGTRRDADNYTKIEAPGGWVGQAPDSWLLPRSQSHSS